MAYATTLRLVSGDTLPVITVTVKDASTAVAGQTLDPDDSATWNPVDLTGASVVLRIREIGQETLVDVIAGTVTNASGGVVQFNFSSNTLASAGLYEGEVEVAAPTGVFTIYDLIKLDVRDDF